MIAKSYILKDLKTIDSLYRKATSSKKHLFYSKLAVIELCGWIEMSMDDIVLACAKRHVKVSSNMNWVKNDLVKRVHGFTYDGHFRGMLRGYLGIACLELLESKLDTSKFVKMKSQLDALVVIRNPAAHTHLKGTAITIDAPSLTLGRFNELYEGLLDIDTILRTYKPKKAI